MSIQVDGMLSLPAETVIMSQMCISSITFAELTHGVEKSAQPEHNLRQVEDFASRLELLKYGKSEGYRD